jgi:hypothetical protein
MDIVYASLHRRQLDEPAPPTEVAEVLDALWAHVTPADGLEHVFGQTERDRVDLLLYLRASARSTRNAPDAVHRAGVLLARSHQASPMLRRRYLPIQPLTAAGNHPEC